MGYAIIARDGPDAAVAATPLAAQGVFAFGLRIGLLPGAAG